MKPDDDYVKKLDRGEYDRPDHIGEATERSIGTTGAISTPAWHRGLIGSGEAVDVHELANNPYE